MANDLPPTWPLSAAGGTTDSRRPRAGATTRHWVPTPPNPLPPRAGVRTTWHMRSGGFPAGSGCWTLYLHSATHTLLKSSIYHKVMVYWADSLCSRQKAKHLKYVSLPASGTHISCMRYLRHSEVMWLAYNHTVANGRTRIWTQAVRSLASPLLNSILRYALWYYSYLSCSLGIKHF